MVIVLCGCGGGDGSGLSCGKIQHVLLCPKETSCICFHPGGRHCYKQLDKELASQLGKWLGLEAAEQLVARDWQQQCVGLDTMLGSVSGPSSEGRKEGEPMSLQAMMNRAQRKRGGDKKKVCACDQSMIVWV